MKIKDFMAHYEAFCPKELSFEGDPVGLQIGSLESEVKKVMVTLDIREQTVQEAIDKGVDLILAKHAIIFKPLHNLTDLNPQEKIVLDLASHNIAVYTSHTNIDVVEGGLNDWFCDILAIEDCEPIDDETGVGRVGNIHPQTLDHVVEHFRRAFNQRHLRIVSYNHGMDEMISRVAICGGSGGSYWKQAKAKGADLYITGDIYYHVGHDMLAEGLLGLDPGHYLEHLFIPKIAEKLRSFGTDVEVIESEASTNPFYDI